MPIHADGGSGSDGAAVWLSQRLDSLERRISEHHAAIRADMNVGFSDLRSTLTQHERDKHAVDHRVTVIETERGIEKQVASRHGAVSGAIAAGLVLGLVESVKKMFGH